MTLRSSIFRKLLLAAALLIAVALGSADFLLTRYIAARERTSVRQEMAQAAHVLAPAVPLDARRSLGVWAEAEDRQTGYRVTVIDSRGVVLADSRHDPETMENHAGRPEIKAALGGRAGSDIRKSATLSVDFLYYALPAGTPGHLGTVLRLAVPLERVGASIAAVRALIWRATGMAVVIALLIAYFIARSLTRRIHRIQTYAKELVNADYSGLPAAEADDELGSVARSLRIMAEQFRGMMERLQVESSRRETILSSMVEGVLAVDRNLRVIFCNDAFARALRVPTPIPENIPVVQLVRDPALRQLLTRVITSGQPSRERMNLISAHGSTFQVQAVPLREAKSGGAIATLHDITELERLERIRKDFVANISHELRTPLAAIRGYTETLLDGALEDPEHNRRFLGIVAAQSDRLANLASDLLSLAEIEADRSPVQSERVAVVESAEHALLAVEAEAEGRNVRAFLGKCENVYVAGQAFRLEQTLLNLLLNAIKYNRPGGEVRIEVCRAGDKVRISVCDTGIGIPADEIPRIFERFYRVDKARSRETGGTGLGLSIVKHNVERMGGSITVESQLGKGSVFTLIMQAA